MAQRANGWPAGPGLQVDVYPLSGVMLDERHHWFVLSWPTVTR
jgi:hypothetical protein